MRKDFKYCLAIVCTVCSLLSLQAQDRTVKGRVLSPYDMKPIVGAVISLNSQEELILVQTDENGAYEIAVNEGQNKIKITAEGYFDSWVQITGTSQVNTYLVPQDKVNYNPTPASAQDYYTSSQTINKRNFKPGAIYIEEVIQGAFPGLYMINKSGMPAEGSFMNYRGVHSFQAENFPLIVVNGVPYIPDLNNSAIIGGYARSVLSGISLDNVENITLLHGADAAVYGSLGSNGVLLIETGRATDLETHINYRGQVGLATNQASIPMLEPSQFEEYIGDVGLSASEDAADILSMFPFLLQDSAFFTSYLYNNDTDWQKEIYENAFITSHNLNVKGGDAIAKYDFALGYLNQQGTLTGTGFTRISPNLGVNINLGKRVEFVSSAGFSYMTADHHNQGLLEASNPVLAALYKAPILNPYRKDENNNMLPEYDVYRQFAVSNPVALVNSDKVKTDAYDLFFNAGLNFKVNNQLKLSALFGLYNGYSRQSSFIPGKSTLTVVPQEDGVALNSTMSGIGEGSNVFYKLDMAYAKEIAGNRWSSGLGYQGLITRREFDAGEGINTSSDFFKTLNHTVNDGRSYFGYIDLWNWMNLYGYTSYNLGNYLTATATLSLDGSSASGTDASRFGLFPGVSVTGNLKSLPFLNQVQLVNTLNLTGGYSILGNSRFSSKLGKHYYQSQIYRNITGIVGGNIANTQLSWEKNATVDLALNASFYGQRVRLVASVFQTNSSDLILPQRTAEVFGSSLLNLNAGEIETSGYEVGLQVDLIQSRDVGLTIGGDVGTYSSEVVDLGNQSEIITSLPDGATVITKVGERPYAFYGYSAQNVLATQQEATDANLSIPSGQMFEAGDYRFADLDENGRIDKEDRNVIGDANPDFFGSGFLNVRYKKFSIMAYFQYSIGNEMYNATRRKLESMDNFYNQSLAVQRRWQTEGQQTDIPRAAYGDPLGNGRFSDRWIEDASYLRLTNLILNYQLKAKNRGFLKGGNAYVAVENVLTLSNYLGLDPVTAYAYELQRLGTDYAKQALPRTFKVGWNLSF